MKIIYSFLFFNLLLVGSAFSQSQAYYDVNPTHGNGLRFWSSNLYKIHMGDWFEYKYGPVTSYSIKTNMSSELGRGWTWGIAGQAPIAALNNQGVMQIAGNFTTYGDIFGKYANNSFSNLYRFGGIYFTWDSDSYGNNPHHSIRSTYGNTSGGNLTINSYNHLRINLDANNNDATSYFEIGENTIDVENILLRLVSPTGNLGIGSSNPETKLEVAGDLTLNTSNDPHLFVGKGNQELNKYLKIINSKGFSTAAGVKVGGVLVAEDYDYANPGKNDMVVRGIVGIGTPNPDPSYKLSVNGKIRAKEVIIDTDWADFVFEDDYALMPLNEVERYIVKNKHLPEIPSAAEVQKDGISIGEIESKLLQKVEELTLYMIALDKEVMKLKEENASLKEKLK